MINRKIKQGVIASLLLALWSGASIFINGQVVKVQADPFVFATLKNLIVGLIILGGLGFWFRRQEIIKTIKNNWLRLLPIIIFGSLPFLLFFWGLSLSSSSMGAFAHKTIFFWVAIMALIFFRQSLGKKELIGLLIIIFGLGLIFKLNQFSFGMGELLCLEATIIWAMEALYLQRLLKKIDFSKVALIRMLGGGILMLFFLLLSGKASLLLSFSATQAVGMAVTVIFLLGYVLLYYYALSQTSAKTVTLILTLGLPVSVLLSAGWLLTINSFTILGIIVIIVGFWLAGQELLRKTDDSRLS